MVSIERLCWSFIGVNDMLLRGARGQWRSVPVGQVDRSPSWTRVGYESNNTIGKVWVLNLKVIRLKKEKNWMLLLKNQKMIRDDPQFVGKVSPIQEKRKKMWPLLANVKKCGLFLKNWKKCVRPWLKNWKFYVGHTSFRTPLVCIVGQLGRQHIRSIILILGIM